MTELKRTLSYKTILLITINSIMGSGMFFLPAIGAKEAGPSSIISWIILAAISIYASACFGELVSMFPKSGGVYEFSKEAYGEFSSFLMGWGAWLIGNITTAMLIVGAITYLLPYNNPSTIIFKILVSIFWVAILNYLTYRGVKTSAIMLVIFAFITIALILFLVIISVINIPSLLSGKLATNLHPEYLTPFFKTKGLFPNIVLILVATFMISEAFFGIESVCFLGEETKDPEKTLPKALLVATIIIASITVIYVLVSLTTIPWMTFSGLKPLSGEAAEVFGNKITAPYAFLAWKLLGNKGMEVVMLWTYLVIIGSAAGFIVTTPRLLLALAKDRLFPPQLSDLHYKYATPYKAILFQTVVTAFFVLIAFLLGKQGYELLLELLVPMVLLMMFFVVLIVPILRKKIPDANRPFKVPFPRAGPLLLALSYIGITLLWALKNGKEAIHILKLAGGFILIGVPFFFLLTFYYNPDAIVLFMENFARFNMLFESFSLPKRMRKEILSTLPETEGKIILDYGAGVGTMTQHLTKAVGKTGLVIATDLSKKNLMLLERRMKRQGISNFKTIHDPHHVSRVHPEVNYADIVVSVGMISYIQDLKKVLNDLYKILPEDGVICFVEYIDFFWLMPNAGWLKDERRLLELFQESGFLVELVKIKGLFWKYLMIYGKKTRKKGSVYI